MRITKPILKSLPKKIRSKYKESYSFNPPMGIFDFKKDPVVLIGKDMWDTLGGEGCYNELLNIAAEVGEKTRERISHLK